VIIIANAIEEFSGEYRWLSNFWPSPVQLDGVTYPTVEHAYQAAKTLDEEGRKSILAAPTPGKAKRTGRKVPMRPDWEDVKISVMEDLLRQKFAPRSPLGRMLAATGERQITEGNAWGDVFWGVSKGAGQNHLGRLIMKIRDESRREDRLKALEELSSQAQELDMGYEPESET